MILPICCSNALWVASSPYCNFPEELNSLLSIILTSLPIDRTQLCSYLFGLLNVVGNSDIITRNQAIITVKNSSNCSRIVFVD